MVNTLSNYSGDITKTYALGEVDTRFPVITDIVPKKNTEAITKGQVMIYDAGNNYYELGAGDDVITNVVVALEDAADTATRVNVLITGLVCIETVGVLKERDSCKIAAAGKVDKYAVGVDAANIQAPIIFMKQAAKINEGLGKAVSDSGTTDPTNKVLLVLKYNDKVI